jgi:hypothetical protein
MTEEQLLSHARRCSSLADACLDPAVARKLRALADDYRAYARYNADRSKDADAPELLPPRGQREQA